ncbi:MAG TPA: hypothetical protein VFS60_06475 [Thermoanaerobaculia bacterium]|nr:hypothetical protein [Thermoanaerobaculia bacterium]
MEDPVYRYLRGYALDPGFSTRLDTSGINEVVYRIPFETLEPGPSGEYVEVIDFDPASNCWYEPLDLGDERVASQQGLEPSEGNPQFHQQLVYAVAMKTIRHFERALGRKIVWYPRRRPGDPPPEPRYEYVAKLRIYPHAVRDANAYYDPDRKALLFGYFTAADQYQGANYPGGLVFTCLSPDIVAHETTHAILDSLHHRYLEDTNSDVAAFHEGFADIVALLQRFTFRELVEHQLYASGGRMEGYNVLGELATQFGEALAGNRGALRSMIGRWNRRGKWEPLKPHPADYMASTEAHDRGAVLVATVFDAFQRIYNFRTADLLRIASNGTGVLPAGSIGRDLVHRLAGEASVIAEHLLHVCIRALDYCPPNDITFGSYLRALITADLDIAPEDENGYRMALIEAFRARGIFPDRVNTLSVSSLRWSPVEFTAEQQKTFDYLARKLKPGIRRLVETTDREKLYELSRQCQAKLHELLPEKAPLYGADWESFLNKLGLTAGPVSQLFPAGTGERFLLDRRRDDNYVPPIEVHTVRPAFRSGREGRQIEQVVITLTQKVTVNIADEDAIDQNGDPLVREMVFRGGCSLIMRLGKLNTVQHAIVKRIKSYRRFSQQKAYLRGDEEGAPPPSASPYADDDREPRLSFNLLHQQRV